ncbi:MAG: outer membrane protein assembly factor BamC [Methylomonas sp.]|nr:outer membrane protein assembly factor BamC [Methylomonas sp.]
MKMMLKNLLYGLPALVLVACADTSERYRDTHMLEMPPELPIEHTHAQTAIAADDMKPRAATALSGLLAFEDDAKKPALMLKTRPDRAWDMVAVALKVGNIEVLDKNREENRFQVKYDPDTAGKEESLWDIFSSDRYPEGEYTITLKEDIPGVVVGAALSKPDLSESGEDASAELIRFLHKTIDEKIINRDRSKGAANNAEE